MNCFAIIPAGGTGKRFNSVVPKQFFKIKGKEVIIRTIEKFIESKSFSEIYIAIHPDYYSYLNKLLKKYKISKSVFIVEGGDERQNSVYNALKKINADNHDIILVHDAVRPYISIKLINDIILFAEKKKCVIPVLSINDTVKKITKNNIVDKTLSRSEIKLAQTPQAFKYSILKKCFAYASANNLKVTDESSIVELCGYTVYTIPGDENNIKITTKADIK